MKCIVGRNGKRLHCAVHAHPLVSNHSVFREHIHVYDSTHWSVQCDLDWLVGFQQHMCNTDPDILRLLRPHRIVED